MHAGCFVSGNAPCWKENRLYHWFLDQSVHSGHFMFWHALISLCMHDLLCLGMPCVGNEKGFISVLLIHLTFCVWVCPVLKRKYALSLLFWSVCACRTFSVWVCSMLKKTISVTIVFLIHVYMQDLVCLGMSYGWKKKALLLFLDWCLHAVPCVGTKRGFIIVFSISLCEQALMGLVKPVFERRQALSLFSLFICACRTFCS